MRAVPCCDCISAVLTKTNLVYNEEAEGHVCELCLHSPVWVPAEKAADPEEWRSQFSSELRDLLETWGETGDRDEYEAISLVKGNQREAV